MRTGELVGDRFQVGPRAGAGGMGTVYRARDRSDESTIALKVFPALGEIGLRRFDREATALARVRHPAVVRYVAHGVDGDRPYIAMEWLEGETLRDRLARSPLAIDEAVAIVRRVSEGVAVAHRLGLVHRDLKPSNVFLAEGAAKVIDFGLARSAGEEEVDLTRTGALLGTVGYMAPEQARAPRDAGPRADVFALAAVLYRCVTGERPYRGRDELETLVRTVFDEVPDARSLAPDVPAALALLLARSLSREPEKRPESAGAFAEELATIEPEPGMMTTKGIGAREQRVTCAVVIGAPLDARAQEVLHEVSSKHGAQSARGRGDERVLTVASEGAATDRAARAAALAMELHAVLPAQPLTIVARREGETPHTPALRLRQKSAGIMVDEVVARLLEGRFEVEETGSGLVLRGERTGTRTLLGRPTPCVGRERELAFLGSLYDECETDGVSRAAIVIAPPGIGKSRLRYELLRRIESRGAAQLWIARGDPMRGGSPFGMASDVLRPLFELDPDRDDDLARRRKIGAFVARTVPRGETQRVADFLAEILRTPGEVDSQPENVQLRAARRSPRLMADQVTRAFAEFVAAQCARAPLVIVLEDLHWGDAPSIALVDAALRACRDLPLMVLAFARPELRERHPGLWTERGATELVLQELGKKPAERLVRAVLGEAAEPTVIARIVEQSGGNAFFLEELIRAVAEGRKSDLPDSVVAMAQARLEALEPDARRVLRAASIFGQSFARGGVAALLAPSDVDPWLDELARRELLQKRDDQFVFRHAFVREAAYGLLTPEDRVLGHRLAGEWLEAHHEHDVRMLADHFERGGDRARAALFHRRAAEQALDANDLSLARSAAERAIDAGAGGEDFIVCARVLAEVNGWSGDMRAAERWGLEALTRAKPGSIPWCDAASETANAAGKQGSAVRLLWLAEQMKATRDTTESERAWLMAASRVAVQLLMTGCYAAATSLFTAVEELGSAIEGDPLVESRIASSRAIRSHFEGNPTAHRTHSAIAADASARAGDLRYRCVHLMNLGVGGLEIGDWTHAEKALRDAIVTAQDLGLENLVGAARNNLGWTLARAGRLAEGHAELVEGLRILQRHGDKRMIGGARSHLAFVHLERRDFELAEEEGLRAVDVLEAAPPLRAQAFALVARARLRRGDLAGAFEAADAAKRQLEALGKLDEGEAMVHLAFVEVLRARGDHAAADAAREIARERILGRAAQIADPRLRDAFLHDVPEHAQLLGDQL